MINSEQQAQFGNELRTLLDKYGYENESKTPTLVLSAFLITSLNTFNNSVNSTRMLRDLERDETEGK